MDDIGDLCPFDQARDRIEIGDIAPLKGHIP
jgi:hypothetical protein